MKFQIRKCTDPDIDIGVGKFWHLHDVYVIFMLIFVLMFKFVDSEKQQLAKMCMEAVLSVKDSKSSECNMDLIRFESKEGGEISDTKMYTGIVLKKSFFHEMMKKVHCFTS